MIYNNHIWIPFNDIKNPFVCKKCGIWVNNHGIIEPRSAALAQTSDPGCVSCDEFSEIIQNKIDEYGLNELGHKYKPDTPSVYLSCEVCNGDLWLSWGISHNILYRLKTCDETIMNKVLK